MLLLILVGLVSGIINSVIGMASLISYPALVSLGVPPVLANASNTVALICSGVSSIIASLKEIRGNLKSVLSVVSLTAVGGLLGSILLLHSSNQVFSKIVPFLIFFAACSMLIPKKKAPVGSKVSGPILWIEYLILALVGVYVGYFGAGAGVIMIAVLSKITDSPYHVYNATRNAATLAANFIASIIFILMIHINWEVVLFLGSGLFCGGFIGPVIVRFIPTKIMRRFVGTFAFILSIYLFIEAFF